MDRILAGFRTHDFDPELFSEARFRDIIPQLNAGFMPVIVPLRAHLIARLEIIMDKSAVAINQFGRPVICNVNKPYLIQH